MYAIEMVFKLFPLNKSTRGSATIEKKSKKTALEKDFFSTCFQEACTEIAQEMGYTSKKKKS